MKFGKHIKCGACGVWNGYLLFKPKRCGFCGRPINSKQLSEKELENLWRAKRLMR